MAYKIKLFRFMGWCCKSHCVPYSRKRPIYALGLLEFGAYANGGSMVKGILNIGHPNVYMDNRVLLLRVHMLTS